MNASRQNFLQSLNFISFHNSLILVSGQCYTFGSNQFGQLGYESDPNERGQPHCVMALQSYCVSAVGCGDTYSVAVTEGKEFALKSEIHTHIYI